LDDCKLLLLLEEEMDEEGYEIDETLLEETDGVKLPVEMDALVIDGAYEVADTGVDTVVAIGAGIGNGVAVDVGIDNPCVVPDVFVIV
jgi:hypothetical protein